MDIIACAVCLFLAGGFLGFISVMTGIGIGKFLVYLAEGSHRDYCDHDHS